MRSRKALINTIAGLSYELVAVICGFILPRLILMGFGSAYNGVTSSITQFLGYVTLMKAGIGGVTKAALYKPLADKDTKAISAVVNATDRFLKRVATIFVVSLVVFACIFPYFVRENFEWFFTFTLVLILGISTFAQYFFGLTYQLVLYSDQRQCVVSIIHIITTILNTLLAAILIKTGATIHIVKLGSAVVFALNPFIVNIYTKYKYKIDKTVAPNNDAIKDRWDCFGLQVANFANANTDLFILTVFTNVYEVSVYTVYHMVTSGIRQILNTFVNGMGAAFGNMFAKKETKIIYQNMLLYEELVFAMANFLFSVTLVMIVSFAQLYTEGIRDVDYVRYSFAYILVIAILFTVYRIPYQSIVEAVGHFKQTRNGAFFEAALNIIVSLILVNYCGLVGVAIGTLCAGVFRTFQYGIYVSKFVVPRSIWILIKRIILSAVTFALVIFISSLFDFTRPSNYLIWVLQSIAVCVVSAIVTISVELLFYRNDLKLMLLKIRGALIRKK